jgi:hypothetical protein
VCEALVVPKGRILKNKPTAWFTDPTPTLALISMATNPPGSVQIILKPEILFMGDQIRILRHHILGRRR